MAYLGTAATPRQRLLARFGTAGYDPWCTLGRRRPRGSDWWRRLGRGATTAGAPGDKMSNWWCTLGPNTTCFCPKLHQELSKLSQTAPPVVGGCPEVHQQLRTAPPPRPKQRHQLRSAGRHVPGCATSCDLPADTSQAAQPVAGCTASSRPEVHQELRSAAPHRAKCRPAPREVPPRTPATPRRLRPASPRPCSCTACTLKCRSSCTPFARTS